LISLIKLTVLFEFDRRFDISMSFVLYCFVRSSDLATSPIDDRFIAPGPAASPLKRREFGELCERMRSLWHICIT